VHSAAPSARSDLVTAIVERPPRVRGKWLLVFQIHVAVNGKKCEAEALGKIRTAAKKKLFDAPYILKSLVSGMPTG